MPAGAIEQQHGVCALCDMARDFVEMQLHHFGVDMGKRERRALAPGRTDRAKQIRVCVALIGGLTRTCSTASPLTDQAILLADAGFVLEPDFDGRSRRQMREMDLQRLTEVFL